MPAPEDQVEFLKTFQRLLEEGSFVSTYKLALLHALADLCVEEIDDGEGKTRIGLSALAEKFVELYWGQAAPYTFMVHDGVGHVLWQSTSGQARILNLVAQARLRSNGSLSHARRDPSRWQRLLREVRTTIEGMPLWKLQNIAGEIVEFIYEQKLLVDQHIVLLPGVAANFRRFHPLLVGLIQGAWMRQIRAIAQNQTILGPSRDLAEFLFGSERGTLTKHETVLRELQSGICFYCERALNQGDGAVDHFVPWTKYPRDLPHNFVLAHAKCNGAKRDFLAAPEHLGRWIRRNDSQHNELASRFDSLGIAHDRQASTGIAHWAYQQAEDSKAKVWVREKTLIPLNHEWRACF